MMRECGSDSGTPITADLVSTLIRHQFPQWSDRAVTPVNPGGWDNRTFRLGSDLLVRMPSRARYASQVAKEQRWLPVLSRLLPLPIPAPVAFGQPDGGYPWLWSVYGWLDGEPSASTNISDMDRFACDLATFLRALNRIDAREAPAPSEHNFFRGGAVATYDHEVTAAISALANRIDTGAAAGVWRAALASEWGKEGVWVHGDVAPANLLVQDGRLAAVIDFGNLGVGDPACDLTIVWTLFRGTARETFRTAMGMDDATWARARGWALWKALIRIRAEDSAAGEVSEDRRVLDDVLADEH